MLSVKMSTARAALVTRQPCPVVVVVSSCPSTRQPYMVWQVSTTLTVVVRVVVPSSSTPYDVEVEQIDADLVSHYDGLSGIPVGTKLDPIL